MNKTTLCRSVISTVALSFLLASCSVDHEGPVTEGREIDTANVEPTTTTVTVTVAPLTESISSGWNDSSRNDTAESENGEGVCGEVAVRVPQEWEISYCDGSWAIAGLPASDVYATYRWNGIEWNPVPKEGKAFTGVACYEPDVVEGIPDALTSRLLVC